MSEQEGYRVPAFGGPATVLGVALEPGERVVFVCQQAKGSRGSISPRGYAALVVAAVVIAFAVIAFNDGVAEAAEQVLVGSVVVGLMLLLVWIFTPREPKAQVITDRRVIQIDHRGVPVWIPVTEMIDINVLERPKGSSSGRYGDDALSGVLAIADGISQISNALENRKVEKAGKLNPDYWRRVTVMEIVGRTQRLELRPIDSLSIGVVVMRFIHEPGAIEREAAVPYEA